jgi:hypothetical protein
MSSVKIYIHTMFSLFLFQLLGHALADGPPTTFLIPDRQHQQHPQQSPQQLPQSDVKTYILEKDDFYQLFYPNPLKMTKPIKRQWVHMMLDDRLPFLFEAREVMPFVLEFADYFSPYETFEENTTDRLDHHVPLLTFAHMQAKNNEFQADSSIKEFILSCDTDKDDALSFREYFLCRCDYSRYGRQHPSNEIDVRDTVLMSDFEELVRSPMYTEEFVLDENGIIID